MKYCDLNKCYVTFQIVLGQPGQGQRQGQQPNQQQPEITVNYHLTENIKRNTTINIINGNRTMATLRTVDYRNSQHQAIEQNSETNVQSNHPYPYRRN